jgi:hypothetical protein
MSDEVDSAVKDAEAYASTFGTSISTEASTVFREAEELAYSLDTYVYDFTYMAVLLRHVRAVRAVLARHGADPDGAADTFLFYTREAAEREKQSTSYDAAEDSYSQGFRSSRRMTRARTIDLAISIAQASCSAITGLTLFEALLKSHEEVFPMISHGDLADSRLHTPYITLAHMLGLYEPTLLIKLSDLRNDLGLPHPKESYGRPADVAPPSVRAAVLAFLVDHPDYERNCFLVMPFAQTRLHNEIAEALRHVLKSHGFNLVRADEHVYSEDLLTNTYRPTSMNVASRSPSLSEL